MKYTENYHLPQWVKSDRIMMDDFNQMCANIEEGLTNTAQTANAAKQTADQAAVLPYAVGTYVGNGEDVTVELGFRPRFVIISGVMESVGSSSNELYLYGAITAGNTSPHRLIFTDTGFYMPYRAEGSYHYPNLSVEGRTYDYIAFR